MPLIFLPLLGNDSLSLALHLKSHFEKGNLNSTCSVWSITGKCIKVDRVSYADLLMCSTLLGTRQRR